MRRPLGLVAIGLGTQVRSAAPPSLSGLQTLTVVTKTREAMIVDLGPPGPSQGDLRVVNAPLYDRTGTNAIGRLDLFYVVTDPADKPGETTHLLICSGTYTLPKGTLTTHGLTLFSALPETPFETVWAITGGTGAYLGARDEQQLTRRSATEIVDTFSYTTC